MNGIVWLRSDFSRKLLAGEIPDIGVFVNGVDANTGRIIDGYVHGVWANWLEQIGADRSRSPAAMVELEQRIWFNPGLRSRDFLVPGLIAVIMTLIGALLTSLVVAREWERGTMEALLVTPVRVPEILLGKILPYFLLGMGGLLFSIGMAVWLFTVPLRGSLWLLLATSALFLLTALGHGPADLHHCPQPVRGRPGGDHRHLFAGFHPFRLHLRHQQYAGAGSASDPYRPGPLLRVHSADGLSRREHLAGDPPECLGPAR